MISGKFVIDAHCHIYPEKIASRAVAGTDKFYDIHSAHDGLVSTLLEKGAEAGIDHFIVQSVATTPHQVQSINEFIARSVKENGGKLTGLGTLHPDSADQAADIRHLQELGLKGVKLHPDIQGFQMDDPRCLKIYDICQAEDLPILMHTGDYRYDNSNPNRLLPVLKKYPNLVIIGAHLGGWSVWDEAVRQLSTIPNLYVDCSSCFYTMDKETALRIIHSYGADKVLFGTDYPMWAAQPDIDYLLSLGLEEDELEKIFSLNAVGVFRL